MSESQVSKSQIQKRRRPDTRIQRRNRKDIIDAAIDIIAEGGFSAARMETVSERSGISRTNIHYYFRTREDLHRAVIKHVLDTWEEVWWSALDGKGTPKDQLLRYVRGKLRASWEHPKLSRIFAAEIVRGAPLVTDFIKNEMLPTFQKACDILQGWMNEGYLNPGNPRHIFIAIWGATQYYADFNRVTTLILEKPDLDESDFGQALETITTMIVGGFITEKNSH